MAGEWTTFRLGDVCTKIGSGATPRGGNSVYLAQGDIVLIRSQNVYNDGFHHDGLVYLTQMHAEQLANVEVEQHDVLLNITGDSVARACQVDPNVLPARVNQHVAIIRPDPKQLWPQYLRYFLVSPVMQAHMLQLAGAGATRNALTKGMIESFDIPAPRDIDSQKAIANILGALDDKIELNRRMNLTLEATARAIFKSWFVDFDPVRAKAAGQNPAGMKPEITALFPDSFEESELGDIPQGWSVSSLGSISDKPQYGYTASASEEKIGPNFLRITDINKCDWIDWSIVPFCRISEGDHKKYHLFPGDVVIARMADPGHGALIEEDIDAVFASYLIRFRPIKPESSRFLQYWLRSDSYWQLVRGRQSGTTRANLNAQDMSAFPLVLPSPDVLKAFAMTVDNLRLKLVANVKVSTTLSRLRDIVLPQLISGALVVNDAARIVGRAT